MKRRLFGQLLAATGGLLASPAIVRAQRQNGVALVIGNSRYKWEASLPNVKRDAPDIAKAFQALGLKTELLENVGLDAMKGAVDKFGAAARDVDFASFYFAGHGAFWNNTTHLVPVDVDLTNSSVTANLIKTASVSNATKGAAHTMLTFDSCRNNPADGWRQVESEDHAFIDVEAQRRDPIGVPNRLVLFSTAPGWAALDGPAGQNSPFAAALLRQLGDVPLDIQALPGRLRRSLLIATQGRQVLFDVNRYGQPYVVGAAGKPSPRQDPAGVVELNNAYANAREHDIPLPPGVVALRTPGNTRHGRKIGAYRYEYTRSDTFHPVILVVLSVDEKGSANLLLAEKFSNRHLWRVMNGTVSGDSLTYQAYYNAPRHTFEWRDADSGSVTLIWDKSSNARPYSTRFTRLDA